MKGHDRDKLLERYRKYFSIFSAELGSGKRINVRAARTTFPPKMGELAHHEETAIPYASVNLNHGPQPPGKAGEINIGPLLK